MNTSQVEQQTNVTEDKKAVTTSHLNEHGAQDVLFSSDVLGTDSNVLILDQCDWESGDCQDGGFLDFLSFLSFSCLTVSPSKEDSSDILWIKEREAPTIGSG